MVINVDIRDFWITVFNSPYKCEYSHAKNELSQKQISVTLTIVLVPIQTTTVSVEITTTFCRLYYFLFTITFF